MRWCQEAKGWCGRREKRGREERGGRRGERRLERWVRDGRVGGIAMCGALLRSGPTPYISTAPVDDPHRSSTPHDSSHAAVRCHTEMAEVDIRFFAFPLKHSLPSPMCLSRISVELDNNTLGRRPSRAAKEGNNQGAPRPVPHRNGQGGHPTVFAFPLKHSLPSPLCLSRISVE